MIRPFTCTYCLLHNSIWNVWVTASMIEKEMLNMLNYGLLSGGTSKEQLFLCVVFLFISPYAGEVI